MIVTSERKSSGFSLIELMIAILIGLIVINGVIQIVISSKRSYLDNQAVSQIQENARFALDTLSREIKMAGYFGCMPESGGEIESTVETAALDGYLSRNGQVLGFEVISDASDFPAQISGDVKAGQDVLLVRHTDPNREYMLPTSLAKTTDISVIGNDAISNGGPVALVSSGCELANVFTWGSGAKPEGGFSKQNFKEGSRVSPIQVHAYYIGQSSVIEDMPALKREVILPDGTATRSEELAMGVSGMTLTMIKASNDGITELGAGASAADIAEVKAIRIELTMRSHDRVNPVEKAENGDVTNDGYIEKSALATVRIRNRG